MAEDHILPTLAESCGLLLLDWKAHLSTSASSQGQEPFVQFSSFLVAGSLSRNGLISAQQLPHGPMPCNHPITHSSPLSAELYNDHHTSALQLPHGPIPMLCIHPITQPTPQMCSAIISFAQQLSLYVSSLLTHPTLHCCRSYLGGLQACKSVHSLQ